LLVAAAGTVPCAVAGGRCSCYCYWGCYFDVEYGTVVHADTNRTVVQAVAGGPVAHGLAGKSAVHAFAGGIVLMLSLVEVVGLYIFPAIMDYISCCYCRGCRSFC
jgi:hypothetical protein